LRRVAAKHLPVDLLENLQIRNGLAAEQIVLAAKEIKADLIVLWAHRLGDPKFAGAHATAEQIIRHSPCPVLLVPPENGGAAP
jgi:nucleotide-binding universal stress UspA family protein